MRPALAAALAGRLEFDLPHPSELALFVDEVDETAAETAHCRDFELAGADRLAERPVEQALGTGERRRRVLDPQPDRADGGAVGDVEGVGKALLFGVHHDVDGALRPPRHRLRLVHAGAREAEAAQHVLERRCRALIHGELDEFGAAALRPRRQRGEFPRREAGALAQLVEQEQQRALPVHRDAAGGTGAELVVEYLEREKVVEAGRLEGLHEVEQRQFALAGEIAEMPAPRQRIHVEHRRVRHLHQEDAVARDGADRLEIGLAGEDMEGVEHEPDRLVVGAAHRLPGIAVVADVAPPGERLEADPHAVARRALAERAKIGRGAIDAAEALRRHVGADEKEIAAELGHQVELALGAGENAFAAHRRHALEVAERLEGDDLEPEIGDPLAHVGRRAVERQQIGLEDLDALEAGGRNGVELLGQIPAERHGCDRQFHDCAPGEAQAWDTPIMGCPDSRLPDGRATRYDAAT